MSRYYFVLLFIFLITYSSSFSQKKELNKSKNVTVKVMTFNIRYANPNDGDNIWENRTELVYGIFKKYKCDFVGTQEVMLHQLEGLKENLPLYNNISRSRNIMPEKGEACPLFYLEKKWKLIDTHTFWLSSTPEISGSKSWESSFPRICTWGLFENRKTGFKIRVYNTHFDHISQNARKESVKLIIKRIEAHRKDSLPFILMGDFNAEPDNIVVQKLNSLYKDCSIQTDTNDNFTFQGWDKKSKINIDYIFTAKNNKLIDSKVIRDNKKGQYPSDHLPVYSKINFRK